MKKWKSAGVENIPAELVQCVEAVTTALMTICSKTWQTGEWPTPWTPSLVFTLPKKGNLQQCQNYRSISLFSHPRKILLKIMLNRLKPQMEKTSLKNRQASEQEGAPATEQIFNLRILCDKPSPAPARPLPCLHRLHSLVVVSVFKQVIMLGARGI